MERYAVVTIPDCFMGGTEGRVPVSHFCGNENRDVPASPPELTDEIFSGWAVQILDESGDWYYIRTFYGYEGWTAKGGLREISRKELEERQDRGAYLRIGARSADILADPRVQGGICETLYHDSVVRMLHFSEDENWAYIESASGVRGWVFASALRERMDTDGFLLAAKEERGGGQPTDKDAGLSDGKSGWFIRNAEKVKAAGQEEELRDGIVKAAFSYLGSQYRWGGKSPMGIDCSGLAFMSYMEQGILIYRDAGIEEGYPVREISRSELKKGDLIFFPGHVGIWIGNGYFIHATGFAATPRVVVSSLIENDPDFRPDLADKVTGCGSIW